METVKKNTIYFKVVLAVAVLLHTLMFFYYANLTDWDIGVLEVFFGLLMANAPVWSIYLWYRNTSNEQLPIALKLLAYAFHFIATLSGFIFYTYVYWLEIDGFIVYLVVPLIQIMLFWVLTAILIWFSILV